MRRRARIRSQRFAFAALRAARRWRRARAGVTRSRGAWMPLALRWRCARAAALAIPRCDRPWPRESIGALRDRPATRAGAAEWRVRERLTVATVGREIHSRSRERERERIALTTLSREIHAHGRIAAQRDRPGIRGTRADGEMRLRHTPVRIADARGGIAGVSHGRAAQTILPRSRLGVARDSGPAIRSREGHATHAFGAASPLVTRKVLTDAGRRAPSASAAAVEALQRAAPLVWRHSPSHGDARPLPAHGPVQAMRESGMPRAPSSMRDAAPSRAAAAAASPPAMPPLDAAFVDRLAEDVIRRVDRRARIERERRGG